MPPASKGGVWDSGHEYFIAVKSPFRGLREEFRGKNKNQFIQTQCLQKTENGGRVIVITITAGKMVKTERKDHINPTIARITGTRPEVTVTGRKTVIIGKTAEITTARNRIIQAKIIMAGMRTITGKIITTATTMAITSAVNAHTTAIIRNGLTNRIRMTDHATTGNPTITMREVRERKKDRA